MADITDLINYYVNLLIIQYHNKPKAQATIALLAKEILANGLIFDIKNAFNVDPPSAVGKQLDVVGKYVGVDRYFTQLILENYYCFITYDETISLPSSPPRWGFSDYSNYASYEYNGTLIYDDIITTENSLYDSDYLTLIKLKIAQNNGNYSHKDIDDSMYKFFGDSIRPESLGNMQMIYFINTAITPLIQAILIKKLLPKPMGVGLSIVSDITGLMFAFTDYSGYQSIYGHGYDTYANYDSTPGQFLKYSQIIEG